MEALAKALDHCLRDFVRKRHYSPTRTASRISINSYFPLPPNRQDLSDGLGSNSSRISTGQSIPFVGSLGAARRSFICIEEQVYRIADNCELSAWRDVRKLPGRGPFSREVVSSNFPPEQQWDGVLEWFPGRAHLPRLLVEKPVEVSSNRSAQYKKTDFCVLQSLSLLLSKKCGKQFFYRFLHFVEPNVLL